VAGGGGIPERVRALILRDINSVEQLEALLLLRGAPDRSWSPEDVAGELRTHPHSAGLRLADLAKGRLVEEAEPGRFRYAPSTLQVARDVDALADAYAKRRVSVISAIFSKPSEAVRSFSDAFRLRGDH
jgi:hypothetical protein